MNNLKYSRKNNKETVILGIDPGTVVMGFAVIVVKEDSIRLIDIGAWKLAKQENHAHRLKEIFENITELIRRYHVTDMAIEAPFYGKNVQSMLKLGRAQGVCIAAAMSLEAEVSEYAPGEIKQAITGRGSASKDQLASMLAHIVGKLPENLPLDASDALGVAVCHYFQAYSSISKPLKTNKLRKTGSGKKPVSWADFVKNNPDRLSD